MTSTTRSRADPEAAAAAPAEEPVDDDVSAGLRIPPTIDMSTTKVDPESVDLGWFDRYTTGEVPVQEGPAVGADPSESDDDGRPDGNAAG